MRGSAAVGLGLTVCWCGLCLSLFVAPASALTVQRQQETDYPTCPLGGPGPWGPRREGSLRVLVHGAVCGGITCEDQHGSQRIEGTNFGNGLRLLGHEVRFRGCGEVDGADVVIMRPGVDVGTMKHGDASRVVVVMKTDSNSQWAWVRQADLHMANSALHSLFHGAYGGLDLGRSVVLRLVEVPSGYWRKRLLQRKQEPHGDMYSDIPQHHVRELQGTPARLCYHGNRYHFAQDTELHSAIEQLMRILPVQILLIQDAPLQTQFIQVGSSNLRSQPTFAANLTVAPWITMDETFRRLAECDLGLVPNLEEPPAFGVNTGVGNAQIDLRYKGSTNAGRAYVMAQVGLPFVSSPEPEVTELLGGAGLRSHEFLALGSGGWVNAALQLLRSAERRGVASRALRAYAERELSAEAEAAVLEKHIREVRAALKDSIGAFPLMNAAFGPMAGARAHDLLRRKPELSDVQLLTDVPFGSALATQASAMSHRLFPRTFGGGRLALLVRGDTVLGYIVFDHSKNLDNEHCLRVSQVAVVEEQRRKGLGRRLVRWAIAQAEELGFAAVNLDALRIAVPFYEALGFYKLMPEMEEMMPFYEYWPMEFAVCDP